MQFAIADSDNSIGTERFDNINVAVEEAKKQVTEDPDTTREVFQLVKVVESTIDIEVTDPD